MGGHVRFDPSTIDWKTFFQQQQSGNGTYFEGIPYQRGYGIGSVFRSLYRFLLPIGKEIGREGLALSGRLIDDLARGQNPKDALVKESRQGLINLMQKGEEKLLEQQRQQGSGRRRGKTINRAEKPPIVKRKRIVGKTVRRQPDQFLSLYNNVDV